MSAAREPEPSFGPDEEGDVPPPAAGRPLDDEAAWVHTDPPEQDGRADGTSR